MAALRLLLRSCSARTTELFSSVLMVRRSVAFSSRMLPSDCRREPAHAAPRRSSQASNEALAVALTWTLGTACAVQQARQTKEAAKRQQASGWPLAGNRTFYSRCEAGLVGGAAGATLR